MFLFFCLVLFSVSGGVPKNMSLFPCQGWRVDQNIWLAESFHPRTNPVLLIPVLNTLETKEGSQTRFLGFNANLQEYPRPFFPSPIHTPTATGGIGVLLRIAWSRIEWFRCVLFNLPREHPSVFPKGHGGGRCGWCAESIRRFDSRQGDA